MATQSIAIVPSNSQFSLATAEKQIQQFIPVLRELVVNGKKLTDDQITGRAMFAVVHGLDPVTEVNTIVDRDGHTMAHSMHIDGYRRKCQEQVGPTTEIMLEFAELTPDQMKRIPNALIGYECRLRDGESYTLWQKRTVEIGRAMREAGVSLTVRDILDLAGPPPIFTGVGIFYQGELNEWKDRNFNPIERAKKRAEVNARHKRFPTNAPIFEGNEGAPVVTAEWNEEVTQPGTFREEKKTETELMRDLGYGYDEQPSGIYTREDAARDMQAPTPEPEEPEMPPAPAPDPLRLEPEALKNALASKAEKMTGTISATQKGLIAATMETVLSMTTDPKASRKQLLHYLTGHDSLNALNDGMLLSLYSWLKPSKKEVSNEWFPDPMAAREALAAFTACQPAQTGLFN